MDKEIKYMTIGRSSTLNKFWKQLNQWSS